MFRKIFVFLIMGFIGLPSFAFFDGKVEKQYFYDNSTTIMQEEETDNTVKTEKYWTENTLTRNKYKPVFMISNNEIINFVPKHTIQKTSNIPSVYNISLKNASVVNVSFKNNQMNNKTISEKIEKDNYALMYEKAKVANATVEEKMNTATILKNTKNLKNYNMAISLLDDITNTEPFNAYAFYIKGELFALKKDFENAMKCFVSSLKINPANRNCYLSIAKMLETTNKTLAQKYYAKANGVNL